MLNNNNNYGIQHQYIINCFDIFLRLMESWTWTSWICFHIRVMKNDASMQRQHNLKSPPLWPRFNYNEVLEKVNMGQVSTEKTMVFRLLSQKSGLPVCINGQEIFVSGWCFETFSHVQSNSKLLRYARKLCWEPSVTSWCSFCNLLHCTWDLMFVKILFL